VLQLNPEAGIVGKVVDENEIGVPMVVVKALARFGLPGREQLRQLSRAVTNEAGEYEVHGLPPGTYTLGR